MARHTEAEAAQIKDLLRNMMARHQKPGRRGSSAAR